MSQITITIATPDTLDTIDFVFEIDDALNMGFKHEFAMWTIEPKRGRWIMQRVGEHDEYCVCSECGNQTESDEAWNYCPNCGARMEDEDEPKPCVSCPYNPVEAMIRNGGEDVCPDAFKPIAIYCARMENE